MRKRIRFLYREFYDVPRYILTEYAGTVFLLESPFDDALDDYSPVYVISQVSGVRLPESEDAIRDLWDQLPFLPQQRASTVPANQVRFDRTFRRRLDATVLDAFLIHNAASK